MAQFLTQQSKGIRCFTATAPFNIRSFTTFTAYDYVLAISLFIEHLFMCKDLFSEILFNYGLFRESALRARATPIRVLIFPSIDGKIRIEEKSGNIKNTLD